MYIGLVSLIYLGWELLCVAYTCIVYTYNLDLVSFVFVPALYSTFIYLSPHFNNVMVEDIVVLYTCTRQSCIIQLFFVVVCMSIV